MADLQGGMGYMISQTMSNLIRSFNYKEKGVAKGGGWVENRLMRPPALRGFTMNMWAVLGLAFKGSLRE